MSRTSDSKKEAVIVTNELTLTNALANGEAAALLGARGYPAERLNEGLALVAAARAAVEAKKAALGAQTAATAAFVAAFALARAAYVDFRETARAHFRSQAQSPEAWRTLGLADLTPNDTEGFIGAAYSAFDNALADEELGLALATYGYDEAGLAAERAAVEAMAAADQAQEQAKGANLLATAERDAAYKAMTAWMGTFKRVARRALRERVDLLAAIGL